jgi:hypothetical protein
MAPCTLFLSLNPDLLRTYTGGRHPLQNPAMGKYVFGSRRRE